MDLYRDGMARLEAGDAEEARRLLEEALRKTPDSVEVMHGLARALDLAGNRGRALELLERAHARAPAAPEPAVDLAMTLLEWGEDTRAARVLTPALTAWPEHTRANLHMAMALAKTDPARARDHARKALVDPDPDVRQQAELLESVLAEHSLD
jgi:Tfp pilus assembly protein PilF